MCVVRTSHVQQNYNFGVTSMAANMLSLVVCFGHNVQIFLTVNSVGLGLLPRFELLCAEHTYG
jgi:hypothetical protein